jgi:hypothetical protein
VGEDGRGDFAVAGDLLFFFISIPSVHPPTHLFPDSDTKLR